jgi:serine/threonine protein kinase
MRRSKYTFIRKLGTGGYGEVWLVRDRHGRFLALKRLLDRAADFVSALREEARKLFRLRGSPGVVQLVDHDLDGEDPCIVMELADGTLLDRINGPLPPTTATSIAYHIVKAVQGAHARGVVHRDIKPDNIFIKGKSLVLGDFGLGKGAESLLLTIGGAGTPGYMAPEQVDGPAFAQADVYGVGATIFHMLTGQRPPPDRTDLDPRWFVRECPADLAKLVRRMTAGSPARRPPLSHVEAALVAFLNPPPMRVPHPVVQPAQPAPAVRPVAAGASVGEIVGGVAVGGLIVLGIAGLLDAIFRGRRR